MLKLADAYGVAGRRATSPDELRRELRAALAADEPTLLEVPQSHQVAPFGAETGPFGPVPDIELARISQEVRKRLQPV